MSLADYIEQRERLRIFREETRAALTSTPTLGVGASTPAAVATDWLDEQGIEMGLSPDKPNFEKWLGPGSKGLTLAIGILLATQSLKAARSYRSQ